MAEFSKHFQVVQCYAEILNLPIWSWKCMKKAGRPRQLITLKIFQWIADQKVPLLACINMAGVQTVGGHYLRLREKRPGQGSKM